MEKWMRLARYFVLIALILLAMPAAQASSEDLSEISSMRIELEDKGQILVQWAELDADLDDKRLPPQLARLSEILRKDPPQTVVILGPVEQELALEALSLKLNRVGIETNIVSVPSELNSELSSSETDSGRYLKTQRLTLGTTVGVVHGVMSVTVWVALASHPLAVAGLSAVAAGISFGRYVFNPQITKFLSVPWLRRFNQRGAEYSAHFAFRLALRTMESTIMSGGFPIESVVFSQVTGETTGDRYFAKLNQSRLKENESVQQILLADRRILTGAIRSLVTLGFGVGSITLGSTPTGLGIAAVLGAIGYFVPVMAVKYKSDMLVEFLRKQDRLYTETYTRARLAWGSLKSASTGRCRALIANLR